MKTQFNSVDLMYVQKTVLEALVLLPLEDSQIFVLQEAIRDLRVDIKELEEEK